MKVWKSNSCIDNKEMSVEKQRTGLLFRFNKGVNSEVKRACTEFGRWLRYEFCFPVRVTIYFKSDPYIKASDGEEVSALFLEPLSKNNKPYAKIATGDYQQHLTEWGKDDALAAVLGSIVHELTHYFQWINESNLTGQCREMQAYYYTNKILAKYAQTREHP